MRQIAHLKIGEWSVDILPSILDLDETDEAESGMRPLRGESDFT